MKSRMPERARTDPWEPQGSNPLGPPGPELPRHHKDSAAWWAPIFRDICQRDTRQGIGLSRRGDLGLAPPRWFGHGLRARPSSATPVSDRRRVIWRPTVGQTAGSGDPSPNEEISPPLRATIPGRMETKGNPNFSSPQAGGSTGDARRRRTGAVSIPHLDPSRPTGRGAPGPSLRSLPGGI